MVVEPLDEAKVKQHFLDRLKERYGISGISYEDLMKVKFNGLFAKTSTNTVGHIMIEGTKVWVLRNRSQKLLKTAYPPECNDTLQNAIELVSVQP